MGVGAKRWACALLAASAVHAQATSDEPEKADPAHMLTDSGIPIPDNKDSLTAGPRGPLMVEDWWLFEKLAHFVRERIPERVVHAKGSGAFGTFTTTHDITDLTIADLFSKVGQKTKVLARFSTVAAERGGADAERDVRGFAVKFYTRKGNWDLVGNNTPVFFVRDPWKFPDFIHTQKRDPRSNVRNTTAMWDFWSLTPESLHQVTILFSDKGIPLSLRHMDGHGSHTFSLINDKGERMWTKFHWYTQQGVKHMTNREAEAVVGKTRESSQADLYESIEKGEYPRWILKIQTMTPEEADSLEYDPFDVTKEWSYEKFPEREVGVMELNENPENYFVQMEMASFSPSNAVPGVGFSPDRMLQFRTFSYADAHRYRLGVNYEMLPVNRPLFEVTNNNYYRDGLMRPDDNGKGSVNYEPNSFGGPKAYPQGYPEPPLPLDGKPAARYNQSVNNGNDFDQPGALYRSMDDGQKERLIMNLAEHMEGVPVAIQRRQIALFTAADPKWGKAVEKALKL